MEHCFRSINHTPHNSDPDLDRVAETVVDLLPVVVQGHDLKRDLFPCQVHFRLPRVQSKRHGRLYSFIIYIPALIQMGVSRRVYTGAERIHIIKPVSFQCTHIFAEQGKHKSFLGLQYLKPAVGEPPNTQPDNTDHKQSRASSPADRHSSEDASCGSRQIESCRQEQHGHTMLFVCQNFFFHDSFLLNDKISIRYLYDIILCFICKEESVTFF